MTPEQILKQYYGYDSFRPGQSELINAILSGRDALAIMPTGAGKSVCYQVPAMILPGLTLVISPLVSLMEDQIRQMKVIGIPAECLTGTPSDRELNRIFDAAFAGEIKLLYIAPERLDKKYFQDFAAEAKISMVTVDEAHCVSQWGHQFRPDYLHISDFIESLPVRPIVSALTATATSEVRDDITDKLHMQTPFLIETGFDRPNLSFSVRSAPRDADKDAFIVSYCLGHAEQSGIIYCSTTARTEQLCSLLVENGISAAFYHGQEANLEKRRRDQEDFVKDRYKVMVATNAFGMGINKSDVRYVIHCNMPGSMENYYQEAGRAGRDGSPAECILLFSAADAAYQRWSVSQREYREVTEEQTELLRQRDYRRVSLMEHYCKSTDCLRNRILSYFGEQPAEPCGRCSNCCGELIEKDVSSEAQKILECIKEENEWYGLNRVVGILAGSKQKSLLKIGPERYPTYGALKGVGPDYIELIIRQMISAGLLSVTDDEYGILKFGTADREEASHFTIRVPKDALERVQTVKAGGKTAAPSKPASEHTSKPTDAQAAVKPDVQTAAKPEQVREPGLSERENALYNILRQVRAKVAAEADAAAFMILTDSTLIDMSRKMPVTRETMLSVNGMGEIRYSQYGEPFLEAVRVFTGYVPDSAPAPEPVLFPAAQRTSKGYNAAARRLKHAKAAEKNNLADFDRQYEKLSADMPELTDAGRELLKLLLKLRNELSIGSNNGPAMLLLDRSLESICRSVPHTVSDLQLTDGLTEKKAEQYGEQLLETVAYFESLYPGQPVTTLEIRRIKLPVRTVECKADLTELELQLFKRLADYRLEKAKEIHEIPYNIFGDKTFLDICMRLPECKDDMLAVYGMGNAKYDQYGEGLLSVVTQFLTEHSESEVHSS